MLETIGVQSIEALFDEIPAALKITALDAVPPALSEMEVGRLLMERAARDGRPLNFIGAGAYEHHIPAPVWAIATRGEFYSAYTPYQAEASQGTLQLIYEYQSMMCGLTGMEVSNASLYDGASALAEACLMAVRANRASSSRRVLMPRAVNPTYAKVAAAIAGNQDIGFEPVDYDREQGRTLLDALQASNLTDDPDRNNEIFMAIRALGRIGPPAKGAVPALVRRLTHEDPALAETAEATLRNIDPDAARKVYQK